MKKIFIIVSVIIILSTLFAPISTQAHTLWFNVDKYNPEVNKPVSIEIGWGHKFPSNEKVMEGYINEIYILDSSGNKLPLTKISSMKFQFIPPQKDVYRILADINPGFLSKTPEGYKRKSKNELNNVLSCFRYDIRAKALLVVDGQSQEETEKYLHTSGEPLEIFPIKNPTQLKKGDVLPLKILYQGSPLAGVEVHATYEGFSDKAHAFAYTTVTDKSGEAKVKLTKKGNWLINVLHTIPYPEPHVCDEARYNYSYTFQVK